MGNLHCGSYNPSFKKKKHQNLNFTKFLLEEQSLLKMMLPLYHREAAEKQKPHKKSF